jgi:hypothetical protein
MIVRDEKMSRTISDIRQIVHLNRDRRVVDYDIGDVVARLELQH